MPIVAIPSDPLPSSVVLGDDFFTLIALDEDVLVRQPESFSQYLAFIEFKKRVTGRMLLGPIESLRGGVRLIIMLAVREHGKFVEVSIHPARFGGQVHESIFDHAGHRMELHDLVHPRLITGHPVSTCSDHRASVHSASKDGWEYPRPAIGTGDATVPTGSNCSDAQSPVFNR
jgi:hypothetical protein